MLNSFVVAISIHQSDFQWQKQSYYLKSCCRCIVEPFKSVIYEGSMAVGCWQLCSRQQCSSLVLGTEMASVCLCCATFYSSEHIILL